MPGAGCAGGDAEDAGRGEELQGLAAPDDDGLDEQEERAGDADVADALKGEDDPVFELEKEGLFGEFGEEAADRGFEGAGSYEEDQKGDEGEGEEGVGGNAEVRRSAGAEEDDEEADEDEDVEELFEQDGGEDNGGGRLEVGGVREDAHDVADAEGQDVVGGERGHEDAGAGEDGGSGGAHHAMPAEDAERVADDAEGDEAGDPDGRDEVEGAELVGRDALAAVVAGPEGVPEEEGADEETGEGLEDLADGGTGHERPVRRETRLEWFGLVMPMEIVSCRVG